MGDTADDTQPQPPQPAAAPSATDEPTTTGENAPVPVVITEAAEAGTAASCSTGESGALETPASVVAEPSEPVWTDITDEFFTAVKDLELGELVHHEIFGLFEAMSAIEMMDPKMDAGMCCNKNTEPPLTFETAVEQNRLKLADLTPAEFIGVADGCFSCMISWLEGHSSAQTLFTCLYLHQPHQIKDRPLRAFCVGMRKLVQVMRNIICHANNYEEEDFEMRDYEIDLHPKCTDSRTIEQLREAEDLLIQRRKQQTTLTTAEAAILNAENAAMLCRLRFVRQLLEALILCWPDYGARQPPTKSEIVDLQRLLAGALDTFNIMRTSIPLGTQPIAGADEPNPMGFSPLVNQRLLPPTFPRFTKIKDRSEAVDFMEQLTQRLRTVCGVLRCQTYHGALNFCIDFSRTAPPCLLSRAVLQTLYFFKPQRWFGGAQPTSEVLGEAMRAFISPPVLTARHPLAQNERARRCFAAFVDYTSTVYSFNAFVQLCGFNKARQRDKLARLLVDLSAVAEEAERVDAYMQQLFVTEHAAVATAAAAALGGGGVGDMPSYFGTWMLYHSLRAMHMYLLAGVELELYAQHEYIYVFWYLSQNLCNWLTTTLSRADQLTEHARMVAMRWPHGAKPPKTKGGAGGAAGPSQSQLREQLSAGSAASAAAAEHRRREANPYYRELVLNQAHSNLYDGYYKAMVAFTKDGRLKQPLSVFDSERVRFEHRFAAFGCCGALPPVPYEEFAGQREFLMREHEGAELYGEAAKSFQRARMLLETLAGTGAAAAATGGGGALVASDQEVADVIRVTKVNMIVMNLMARGHQKDTQTAPTFDFATHKFYPTIRIQ